MSRREDDIQQDADPSGLDDLALLSQARQEFSDIKLREKQIRDEYDKCNQFLALQQWSEANVANRGWNIPSLVVDQLGPIKSQIVNDWIRNRMGIQIGPGDEEASEETAKVYSGLVRNVEYISKATAIYDDGFGQMVGANRGYVGILTRRKPGKRAQELYIRGFVDAQQVYFGQFKEIDQSDLYTAFVIEQIQEDEFKRKYPEAQESDFKQWGGGFVDWYKEGERAVTVAEWWKVWFKKRTIHFLPIAIPIVRDGRQMETDAVYDSEVPQGAFEQGLKPVESHREDERIVMQYDITGKEILSRTRWLGRNIPVFQFKGRTYYVKGEKRMFSAISPALDSQASLNYAESGIAEQMGSTVHAPWIGPVGSFKSQSQSWQLAAVKRFPYLEYDPVVVQTNNGMQIAPPPQRQSTEAQIQSYLMAADHAANNIRFTTGITKSAQGIDDRTAKSGIAKREDAAQSDNSSFDWHSSGAQTLALVGDAIVDVAPKLIPKNELIQILDDQDKQASVLVNVDIATAGDRIPKGQTVSHFLDRGEYRVRVSAAPSNESIRRETQEQLGEIYKEAPDPQKVALLAPLIRSTDINGKDELADRVELPEFKKPKDGQPDIAAMQELIQAGQEFKQHAEAIIDELSQKLETKQAETDSKERMNSDNNATKLAIAEMQVEQGKIAALLDVLVKHAGLQQDMAMQESAQAHAASEGELTRQHSDQQQDRQMLDAATARAEERQNAEQ